MYAMAASIVDTESVAVEAKPWGRDLSVP